jgi:hypothetical protein
MRKMLRKINYTDYAWILLFAGITALAGLIQLEGNIWTLLILWAGAYIFFGLCYKAGLIGD